MQGMLDKRIWNVKVEEIDRVFAMIDKMEV